ncbi:trypsin-like serine peptidase [Allorhodopirellula heiligendammensis]|uniref:Serine protease n=1 Tax=Allorhodopirellula heiligendammensis TaxID=2714739 RepID=A0A5C6BEK7_9BACT|nr:serine protease [Allorhodopirellula heiligendammensis]TWU09726.1 hypothetical protein Poly21_55310 [Allorhodopirellula heiligendammensis]
MYFQISASIADSHAELADAAKCIDAVMDECTQRSLIRGHLLARSSGVDVNQIDAALELFADDPAFTAVEVIECEGCGAVEKPADIQKMIVEYGAYTCSRCDRSVDAESFRADDYCAAYYFEPDAAKRMETPLAIPPVVNPPVAPTPGMDEPVDHELTTEEVQIVTELFESCFDSADAVMDFVLESCTRPISREIETRNKRSAIRSLREKAHNHALLGEVLVDLAKEFPNKQAYILAVAAKIQDKYVQVSDAYEQKALSLTASAEEPSLNLGRTAFLEKATSLNPFLNLGDLRKWCEHAESRVCRVRSDGDDYGTGFLVGPDLVLTCFHVVKDFISTHERKYLSVCFDPTIDIETATAINIDSDWDIPFSKVSETDLRDNFGVPEPDELDFALLKLTEGPGETRGFFQLRDNVRLPRVGEPILIAGHPGPYAPLQELKFSMAAPGFEKVNKNQTRLIYKTSTLEGSSGSPVFDRQFRLIGLHHNRGEQDGRFYANNRGIPIKTIAKYLAKSTWADLPEIQRVTTG